MARYQPAYDLEAVKRLTRDGNFTLFSRPFRFILNRYDGVNPAEVAQSVIEAICKENFNKSDELAKHPGTFADIYSGIKCPDYPEETWYAKIVVSDVETILEVWSLNWDDYIH